MTPVNIINRTRQKQQLVAVFSLLFAVIANSIATVSVDGLLLCRKTSGEFFFFRIGVISHKTH